MKKIAAPQILNMKHTGRPVVMVTAYDYPTSVLASRSGADIILVGDSLGMVVLGYEDTLKVTMADMIHHCRAVSRGADGPMTVGDLPFLSYQISMEQAVQNAGKMIQEGGMDAVKLEGAEFADRIQAITNIGIPVMGHLGLTPQSIKAFGGSKTQGKTLKAAQKLLSDARKLEDAGVFAIVLEGIPAELATLITQIVKVPTIGIGAGAGCDGQVLVFHDLLAIPDPAPFKFVHTFAEAGKVMEAGLKAYVNAVIDGDFPLDSHATHLSEPVLSAILKEDNRKCM